MKRETLILILWEVLWMAIFITSIWQHDLITVGPVWSEGWSHPNGRYADDPFVCFLIYTTIGRAYDSTFALMFVSYIAALAGMGVKVRALHSKI